MNSDRFVLFRQRSAASNCLFSSIGIEVQCSTAALYTIRSQSHVHFYYCSSIEEILLYTLLMRTIPFLNSKFLVETRGDADDSILAEIFLLREYALIEPVLKTAKTVVLDIGAHKGFFALYVRALNETVPILCYEPEEINYVALKRHLEINKIQGVVTKNVAAAKEEGTLLLNVSEDSHNHSIVVAPGTTVQKKVNATTLEKIVSKFEKVDVLKMDIEGAEFQIFENINPEVLQKIGTLFMEYHQYGPSMQAEVLQTIFKKSGFTVKKFPSKYDKRMGFLWATRA